MAEAYSTPVTKAPNPDPGNAPGPFGGGYQAPSFDWLPQTPNMNAFLPDPKQYDNARSEAETAKSEQIKLRDQIDRRQQANLDADEDARRKALNAEAYSASSLPPPWDADKESSKYISTPLERFGSLSMVFAQIAAGFSKQPMLAAMNASAAAMNAIREGDEASYERAHKAWKENTELAKKRFDMQHDLFNDTQALFNTDITRWKTENEALAARFNDVQTLTLLRNGMYPEAIKLMESRSQLAGEMVDQVTKQDLFNAQQAQLKYFMGDVAANHGPNAPPEQRWNLDQVGMAKALKTAELGAKDLPTRFYSQGLLNYFLENGKPMPQDQANELFERARTQRYGGRVTAGQDKVQRIAEREQQLIEDGVDPKKAHQQAAVEIEQEITNARKRPALSSFIETEAKKYNDVDASKLVIPTQEQPKVEHAITSSENLERIAEFITKHPKALGLVADAAKNYRWDAYKGVFTDRAKAAESRAEVESALDKEVEKLGKPDMAADARELNKLLTTQAFNDAVLAGARGGTIYLDKAFREIYAQDMSHHAFFGTMRQRYVDADNLLAHYGMGFNDRKSLEDRPFWKSLVKGGQVPGSDKSPATKSPDADKPPDIEYDLQGNRIQKHSYLPEGARKGVGQYASNYYIPDPERPGKYRMVI